ncbi:PREDICTED: zinc finger protein 36, C3H1 type-like 3 isoform X4 [Atta colombica]|uniref:zinc finger protein 36, C3H1 type-like 3 isoform X4 n=1 Tax=Atta colombica TaxID=520822 RepID=UPI00084C2DA6|nr:PREDICTED: zinc finger protein 36, C3H1 type-like 3 isoform X4 [Atta colombica]
MAMVSMNNLLNGKDSRWLQLEVCREFQRNKCTRPDTECKFAHPPANVEVQNGRVTACYDSIKGRCNREKPPCKYFHPPQHLKDQLLINGRNHLALKNALMQQIQQGLTPGQTLVPGQVPAVEAPAPPAPHHHLQQQIQQQLLATHAFMATNPYLTGMPQVSNTYSPYFAPSPIMPAIMGPADPTGVGSPLGVVPQTVAMPQKMPRTDRLEVCREFQRGACKRGETECRFAHPLETVQANEDGSVTVCMDAVKGRCNRDPCRYFHPPLHLQAHIKAAQSRASIAMDMKSVGSFYYENFAFPGMVPYKRPAADKSGVPVYQPTGATTYQQLMQLQQPFVPVSCEYTGTPPLPTQTSNQSVVQPPNVQSNHHAIVVQSSSSQGAAGATVNNCADANNGVLMDPNNPPPPPPTADNNSNNSNGNNKQPITTQNHDENSRNSPELNHSSPSSLQQQQQQQQVPQQHQQQQQINQLALSPAMSPLTSMASLTSMPGMVNMASMASMASMANMSSITNITSMGNYNAASNMASLNMLNSLGMASGLPAPLDPATLAKEVAQKNYAKALKLSQVSQYGIGQLALNYTGVALNKQNLMNPAAAAAGNPAVAAANLQATAATPRPVIPSLAGIPGALTSPLSAGILAYTRPPPTATPINPYSLIRQQILPNPYVQASIPGAATVQTNPYVQNPYAVLPAVASVPGVAAGVAAAAAAAGVPQIPQIGNPATIAAQPQVAIPVSSGVIMQPYKKMKTS